jgi:hypothetical protein
MISGDVILRRKVRHRHLPADRHRQARTPPQGFPLHMSTDPLGLGVRKNPDFLRLAARPISDAATPIN